MRACDTRRNSHMHTTNPAHAWSENCKANEQNQRWSCTVVQSAIRSKRGRSGCINFLILTKNLEKKRSDEARPRQHKCIHVLFNFFWRNTRTYALFIRAHVCICCRLLYISVIPRGMHGGTSCIDRRCKTVRDGHTHLINNNRIIYSLPITKNAWFRLY